jgi:ABC-2 type transport system ATP-binding protein
VLAPHAPHASTEPPPALDVRGLEKSYGELRAVAGVSLSVAPGEILGLVGPNGAGKTTTLRCLGGILRPTAGTIRIAGKDLLTDPVGAKRELAFLPDEPRLFEHLTVVEHLNLVARLYNVASWEAKADALLAELELTEKRNAVPSELSRGMKQKLTIACGFLHEPSVVLLDEPLTGLDPIAIRKMRQSITLRAARGAAILLSSHLLPLVEEVCHRICVIARGQVRALGTIDEIRTRLRESHAGANVTNVADDVSLEELFVRVTEESEPRP